ncbi:CPBP family intramembrane metalloprotease [Nakamurella antarctica]|uniref:CPBP family intramembrane metalloprotease n=1 Tax=Nakamurella antarctica TaxID=1902245 RepID=A0A3G8ZS25_9ACTN|nr:type II CAAX endopeptidase family protein [Nakamurella antarctica]AZI57314.1 CPBP family intramembrane metalloprotease [Nakamurella antarctica]
MNSAPHDAIAHPWIQRHQFVTFVALAYAFSWTLWLLAAVGGGQVPFLIGGLGPMVAAATVIRWTGGSLRTWIRPVWRWRVPVRWWAYSLGLPALLYGVISLVLQLTGAPVNWSLAFSRLPDYAAAFAFVLILGGGLEEPGWRGFGLPLLQKRLPPVRATLLLGFVWGVWHVPLYGPAGFVIPMVLAFFYTVLWNRTRSVGLCILLHASFTPAQDQLILMARDRAYTQALDAPDFVILGVYAAAVIVLIALTQGRLGAAPAIVEALSSPNSEEA